MLVFFIIIGIIVIFNILVFFSTIKIELLDLKIDTLEKNNIDNYKIRISVCLRQPY